MKKLIEDLFNEILKPKGFELIRIEDAQHPPITFVDGEVLIQKYYKFKYRFKEYSGSVPIDLDSKENHIRDRFIKLASDYGV